MAATGGQETGTVFVPHKARREKALTGVGKGKERVLGAETAKDGTRIGFQGEAERGRGTRRERRGRGKRDRMSRPVLLLSCLVCTV
jgi:hypothetical protein